MVDLTAAFSRMAGSNGLVRGEEEEEGGGGDVNLNIVHLDRISSPALLPQPGTFSLPSHAGPEGLLTVSFQHTLSLPIFVTTLTFWYDWKVLVQHYLGGQALPPTVICSRANDFPRVTNSTSAAPVFRVTCPSLLLARAHTHPRIPILKVPGDQPLR